MSDLLSSITGGGSPTVRLTADSANTAVTDSSGRVSVTVVATTGAVDILSDTDVVNDRILSEFAATQTTPADATIEVIVGGVTEISHTSTSSTINSGYDGMSIPELIPKGVSLVLRMTTIVDGDYTASYMLRKVQ